MFLYGGTSGFFVGALTGRRYRDIFQIEECTMKKVGATPWNFD